MPETRDVVVVGEALVDIVRAASGSVEAPGGSPANVALTLGRAGRRVALVTRLGDDARGRQVRIWLEASGVEVLAGRTPRTSTATATLDATGAATYEFDLRWEGPHGSLPPAPIVHVGSISALLRPGADVLEEHLSDLPRDTLVSYDPNVRPSLIEDADDARERVSRLVARADVIKASDEDIAWLHPGADPQDVARMWVDDGAALVVVTAGARGAFAAYAGGLVDVPARPTRVVDTVGAGDTVMGTLLDGLLDILPPTRLVAGVRALAAEQIEALVARALAAAAITVSRPGADPPWPGELGS